MATTGKSRIIERTITINATVEEVWKALTDPNELTRWFALEAEVTPGVGGNIVLGWGPDMRGANPIEVWEPNRHLRTKWFEPSGQEGQRPLVVDYLLESQGGKTVLRLVHSGFGDGADWDEEYDGISRGWQFELRSLRHYLERQSGRDRTTSWARVPVEIPFDEAWERFMSPKGLLAEGAIEETGEGGAYAFTTALGELFDGRILVHRPPTDFAGTVENMDGAIFRLGLEAYAGKRECFMWLHSWHIAEPDARERQERWTEFVRELLAP